MGRLPTAAIGFSVIVALAGTPAAFAQSPVLELSYQYSRYGSGNGATSAPLGGAFAVVLHVLGPFSAVGFADASRAHGSSTAFSITEDATTTFLAYGAGIRVGGMKEGLAPFLQIAGGAMSQRTSTRATGPFLDINVSSSNTHALGQAGVGATAPLKGRWQIVVDGDYRRIVISGGDALNGFRIAAGVRREF